MPDEFGNFKGIQVTKLPVVQKCPASGMPCRGACLPGGRFHKQCQALAPSLNHTVGEANLKETL